MENQDDRSIIVEGKYLYSVFFCAPTPNILFRPPSYPPPLPKKKVIYRMEEKKIYERKKKFYALCIIGTNSIHCGVSIEIGFCLMPPILK